MKKIFLPMVALLLFVGSSGSILAQITVTGAGIADVNGYYPNTFSYEGKNAWWASSGNPPYDIVWRSDALEWRIVDQSGNYRYYFNTHDTGLPPASDWQVGENGTGPAPTMSGTVDPLPVELASMSASAQGTTAKLQWSTATEVNSYGFDVERRTVQSPVSTNAQSSDWTTIGFVQANGTSNSLHHYSYADRNLAGGAYAYRLKQIDKGGGFKYLQEKEVTIVVPNIFSLAQNYPDPFNPTTTIQFTVPSDGRATLRVFNVLGQEVATLFDGVAAAGEYHRATFDASRLASGIYFSRLEFDGKMQLKKMVLLK